MRSYKSIERPSQVLGMNIQDLGIMVGLFIGSVLAMGILGGKVKIPRLAYLVVVLAEVGGMLAVRYLSQKKAPGFLIGWISYTFIQPRRISVGQLPPPPAPHEKAQNSRI
jgi:hypothetical protein